MNSEIKRCVLASEKMALDIYLDSLYEDVSYGESSGASVISLVPETAIPESNRSRGSNCKGNVAVQNEQENGGEVLRLLLFRLCGLGMAVPLSDIERSVDWPLELFPASDGGQLCLGLLEDEKGSIPVMDLAGLVVPERLRSRCKEGNPTSILIIFSGGMGLACHEIDGVVGVDRGAVNWRTERTNRKWLAGTVPALGRALLDTNALRALLPDAKSACGVV